MRKNTVGAFIVTAPLIMRASSDVFKMSAHKIIGYHKSHRRSQEGLNVGEAKETRASVLII
jgi:hypothetical protein